MNLKFKSELKGGELFKKSVLFLIGFIVAMIAFVSVSANSNAGILAAVILYVLVIVGAFALDYVFLATLINAVSFNEEKFTWEGSFGKYMAINMKGIFLTLITAGIYGAWYIKHLTDYLAESIKYPNKDISFRGEAKKLLKYIFLSFIFPLIAVVAISMPMMLNYNNTGLMVLGFIIYIVGIFAVCSIYYFFSYKWSINFLFGEDEVVLEAEMKKTMLFLFGQFLLIIITFGIYGFAAQVKIFAYFTNNVTFTNIQSEKRFLSFEGLTKDGFWLMLGQTLLCLVTLGIYTPWAYANIQNWFISNVTLLETDK